MDTPGLNLKQLKRVAQSLPGIPAAYWWTRNRARSIGRQDRPEIFDTIYRSNAWQDPDSRSGPGSNLEHTIAVRRELPRLLLNLQVQSLLDAPCGDYQWLSGVKLGHISYTGVDIVDTVVERNKKDYGGPKRSFLHADIVTDLLPRADLVLCRDCLVHLSYLEAIRVISNFRRTGSGYILTTTFPDRRKNFEIHTGGWRPLNLCKPPFNFPTPISLLSEEYTGNGGRHADKSLGLWRLDQLPPF